MRPGSLSQVGFLGWGESLVEILREDEEIIMRLGISHEQIANRIEYFMTKARFWTNGKFVSWSEYYRGSQECPWECTGKDGSLNLPYSNADIRITNLWKLTSIRLSGLIVHLIRDHHFYEGRSSPYRADPELLAKILELRTRR